MKWWLRITVLLLCSATVRAQTFSLKSVALNMGGGQWLQAGGYSTGLSLGQQTASGVLTAGPYRATLGFWHHPDAETTGVGEGAGQTTASLAFRLSQNLPNPFGRRTAIRYALPQETDVALRVYTAAGRIVTTLVSGRQMPGRYSVSWDVSGVPAARLPCGTYFCRLEAGDYTATLKIVKSD